MIKLTELIIFKYKQKNNFVNFFFFKFANDFILQLLIAVILFLMKAVICI